MNICFDYERAFMLMNICADIFDDEWFTVERFEKNNKFYLRISYKDTQFDFKCYRYC